MTRRALAPIVVLLVALALPADARAQVTLGLHTGVGVLAGDDFDGNEGGTTFNFDAMFGPEAGWQFGGAVQYTGLGIEQSSESVGQLDLLGAVRYLFKPELAQIYVGARGGFSRQGWELEGIDFDSSGFSIGPNIGVILPFPWFGFEIAMDARYITFGDRSLDGVTLEDSGRSGLHVGGRIGVSYPLGN